MATVQKHKLAEPLEAHKVNIACLRKDSVFDQGVQTPSNTCAAHNDDNCRHSIMVTSLMC